MPRVKLAFIATICLCFLGIQKCALGYPDRIAGSIPLTLTPQVSRLGTTGRYLYLLGTTSSSFSVIDTLLFKEIRRVSFTGSSRDLAISSDGKTLFVLTDHADQLLTFDLADPSKPVASDAIDIGTSSISFDQMAIGLSSGNEILTLTNRSKKFIYVYDRTTKALRKNGSVDHIVSDIDPISIRLPIDGIRVVALSPDGLFRTYSTTTLLQLGNSLDIGSLSSTKAFNHVQIAHLSGGNYAFASNDVSPGEIFTVNMTQGTFNVFVVDANPDTSDLDPIPVKNEPSGSLAADVLRPKSGENTATYLFVANRGSNSLSVIDLANVGAKITPLATIANVNDIPSQGMSASSSTEGYLFAADNAGSSVNIITDQPFLTLTGVPTGPVGSSDITVKVKSTRAGSLSVLHYTGATTDPISSTAGDALVTTSLSADTDTSVKIPTTSLVEGDNTIAFFLTSGDFLGRVAFAATKDTNPTTPTNFRLNFGNKKIFVNCDRVDLSDMDHYLIYFGTDHAATSGVGGLSSPISISQPESGGISHVLDPVPNGVRIYIKMIAVDKNGNQSPPTSTLSETAEETIGIIGLTGETGGCHSLGMRWISCLFLLFILLGKRKRVFLCLLIFFYCSDGVADERILEKDASGSQRTSTEIRVDWWIPKDETFSKLYGNSGNQIFSLRFGLPIGPLDVGADVGFLWETAPMIGVSTGRPSGEESRTLLVPFGISAQYALRFSKRQVLVPFAQAGYTATYFDLSETTDNVSGVKQGMTFGGGLRLVLDHLTDSNDLEDMFGITHFYIEGVGLYRLQFTGGLDLGGWTIGPGLGVEF